MAGSLNSVQIIGNVGQDPEIKTLNSGDRVANLSVATSEQWTDKSSGEKKEKTEWHRVVVFGGLCQVIEKYVSKGSKVYLKGQLQTRKWQDQSGADRYSTEIVLRPYNGDLILLGGKGEGGGASSGGYGRDEGYSRRETQSPRGGGPREDFSADLDDEIPF